MADWSKFTMEQLIDVNEMALRSKHSPKAEKIEFESRQEIYTRMLDD